MVGVTRRKYFQKLIFLKLLYIYICLSLSLPLHRHLLYIMYIYMCIYTVDYSSRYARINVTVDPSPQDAGCPIASLFLNLSDYQISLPGFARSIVGIHLTKQSHCFFSPMPLLFIDGWWAPKSPQKSHADLGMSHRNRGKMPSQTFSPCDAMVGFCGVWKLELERPSRKKGISSTKPTNRRYRAVPWYRSTENWGVFSNRKWGTKFSETTRFNQNSIYIKFLPNKTDGADKPATRRVCWATHWTYFLTAPCLQ